MRKNVYGTPLVECSTEPMTGFYRDGCCYSGPEDRGLHMVCAIMTDEFLEFSRAVGNDLSTPRPEYDFPGLVSGDRWCICLPRWIEAFQAGKAPRIYMRATSEAVLQFVPIEILKKFAIDEE